MQSKPSEPRCLPPASGAGAVRRRRPVLGAAVVVGVICLALWCSREPSARPAPTARRLPSVWTVSDSVGPSRQPVPAALPSTASAAVVPPGQVGQAAVAALERRGPGGGRGPGAPYALLAVPSGATTQSLTLTVSDYRLEPAQGGRWTVVLGDAWPLAVQGEAALPVLRHDVLLGERAEPELEVMAAAWEESACPPLLASPGFVSRAGAPPGTEAGGLAGRGRPGWFPDTPVRLTQVYRWRGCRGVGVIFCPFRYDAAAGVLGICRRLEIRVRGAVTAAELAGLPGGRLASAAQRWPEQTAEALKGPGGEGARESLLVLVPEFLTAAPALAEYALWKEQRGVAVSLQPVPLHATVPSIRALISAFAAGKERANVLLLGDETAIPPAQASTPPSDTLYALLDGAADRYHDLSISRLTAMSAGDLAVQLGRTVLYERWQWPSPGAGAWCAAGTAVASSENQGNLGLLDREAMEAARTDLIDYGYSPCDALYDQPGYSPRSDALAASWNSGRGLILYLGHGVQQSWRTTGFAVADVGRLLHYGAALPLVVSAACHTGNFALSTDCLCEAFLKGGSASEPTGAVAAIGATSSMDWDPPVVMLQSLTAYLTRRAQFASGGLTFTGGTPRTTVGDLTFAAVQRAVDFCLATPVEGDVAARKIAEQVHLFGDPTLGVRTRAPTALRVSHGQVAVRGMPFAVTVQDAGTGRALTGLTVCLHAPSAVQWLATTDDQGGAALALPDDTVPDSLTVTVYAPDVIPYQAVVPVGALVPALEVTSAALPVGRRGVPYAASLVARGGSGRGLQWSVLSPLPPGLSLVPAGTLAGTPSAGGTWPLLVRVVDDSEPPLVAEAEFELLIECPVYIDIDLLPDAESCQVYVAEIQALGTWPPFSFSVPEASAPGREALPEFPAWLTLAPSGQLSGLAPAPTTAIVPIQVTDAAGYEVTALLSLTIHATPVDRDGDADVDSLELLRCAAFAHSGCCTAAAWTGALERWEQGGQGAPAVPAGAWRGAAPRRAFGAARYLPGGEGTLRIDFGLVDPVLAGDFAILSEVLPAGWQVTPASGRDALGRVLPGPRRDGPVASWFLDATALRGGRFSFGVRPAEPALSPAGFSGWIAGTAGVAPTAGAYLWWPRRKGRFELALRPGWNLVSLPLEIPSGALPAALAALGLRQCDSRGQVRGRVLAVSPLTPYWVYAPAAAQIDLVGFELCETTRALALGWNAYGVSRRLSTAALPGSPPLAWAWVATRWERVHTDLLPGCGYLVFRRE